ncbi:hypothetical protein [Zobellia uliginosa]|uniref:hypothetical protein n=1 Tax=Zobellia uliginosa TaxID=143224 RepID=UPI001C06CA99|nr:hypothetical protein [Zobellia uliginosa]MBU2945400.1 hypothetical protein [Zobellia uliginosa]
MVKKFKIENLSWTRRKKESELYKEIQQWKSNLRFLDNEVVFLERLLDSYVFEPDTPALFEWLENHKRRLRKVRNAKKETLAKIREHQQMLAGILECSASKCDENFYKLHASLQNKVKTYVKEFGALKSDIFNYAGTVLKKRKP